MTDTLPTSARQLQSTMQSDGRLVLALADADLPVLGEHDVLIRVEAAPVNPSDIGNLFGPVDPLSAQAGGTPAQPALNAAIPAGALAAMRAQGPKAGRLDQAMPMGNEGAGTVVAAGAAADAQALLGHRVAALGGGMYATHRVLSAAQCLQLPPDATAAQGASCFVNPLTALAMVETMRLEGHSALIHTAAASNLGQMLNRICLKDGVPLISIVRSPTQVALLREQGAQWVLDMNDAGFEAALVDACEATGATIAFDATGGGTLASRILHGMEAALQRKATSYSRYGTEVHKQVYLYGNLETGPTVVDRGIGMSWGVGGFLLWPAMNRLGPARVAQLKQRVADELHTTFASHYAGALSLTEALTPEAVARYGRRATGEKYLICPNGVAAAGF